ncbi:thermonuclease family protein [Candidatus Uhrbacteria bacterium]|nr:thermonuclease family protein [Candidatus Uhrbacteria bacterium]
MSKRKLYRLAILFIAGFIFTISLQAPAQEDRPSEVVRQAATSTNAVITRVVDGDTVEARLDTGDEATVRLLGINTPETVDPRRPVECFGKEASNYMKQMVDGQRVRLDADTQADDIDKYGRLLRNIVLDDGTDINARMVRDGYAYAYIDFPLNKNRKAELVRLEEEARTAERGLWSQETCAGAK